MWSSAYSCWCSRQPDLQFVAGHFPITIPVSECVICQEEIPFPWSVSNSEFAINCWTNDSCGHSVCARCGLGWEKQTSSASDPEKKRSCPLCRAPWNSSAPREFLERSCPLGGSSSQSQQTTCRKSSVDVASKDPHGTFSSEDKARLSGQEQAAAERDECDLGLNPFFSPLKAAITIWRHTFIFVRRIGIRQPSP